MAVSELPFENLASCHFHDFLVKFTLVRTYLITYCLADSTTPTQYAKSPSLRGNPLGLYRAKHLPLMILDLR